MSALLRGTTATRSVSIQGELGSNSHLAAQSLAPGAQILPCPVSSGALDAAVDGRVEGVVLPIENSLHGAVSDHYDLLLARPLRMVREFNLRIAHNVIARPGVSLAAIRRVLSHPVALSQCRRWLAWHVDIDAITFYDTAGSVKHVVEHGLTDAAGIAPLLAAEVYGGEVLATSIEDSPENYTRFHLLVPETALDRWRKERSEANKMSLAFSVKHKPGSLVEALDRLAQLGADLTKIESRPVPGRPWEYLFFVDVRFSPGIVADRLIESLAGHCTSVRELGRYQAAVLPLVP